MGNLKKRGGKRPGAGRPVGTGRYRMPTKVMRIPVQMEGNVIDFIESQGHSLPFYSSKVQAGKPMPIVDEPAHETINLYSLLIKHPDDTYVLEAIGESMTGAGINSGDLLVVDAKLTAQDGDIVVVSINHELTVKRLKLKYNKLFLMPENDEFQPIAVEEHDDLHILGIVTNSIRRIG